MMKDNTYRKTVKSLPLDIDGTYTSVQFSFVNTLATDFTFNIFNGYSLVLIPTFRIPFIPNPPPYISGSIGYNFFLRGLAASPLGVRQIMLVTENQEQLSVPLELVSKDANGIQYDNPRLPNIYTSVNQYQGLISYIDFRENELILDNQTTVHNYTVKANTTVTMVIWYKQVSRREFLPITIEVCDRVDLHKHVPNNRTEYQLEFQAQRPQMKPNWINVLDRGCSNGNEDVGRPIFNVRLSSRI
jgi:hypothetical protein